VRDLVLFLVKGLATYPDDIQVNAVEGEAVVMFELKVHPDDVPRIIGTSGRNIKAIRQILSAAGGRRKVVLELIEDGKAVSAGEEDAAGAEA